MNGSKFLQVLTLLVCLGMAYFCYKTYSEAKQMHAESQEFFAKADSLLSIDTTQNAAKPVAGTTTRTAGLFEQLFSDLKKDSKESQRKKARVKAAKKIIVTMDYRIEDRYVIYDLKAPDYLGDEPGVVGIQVVVDRFGDVKKTSVHSATTITDENVIDAARKAALKTHFNSNLDATEKQNGVITYNYKLQE